MMRNILLVALLCVGTAGQAAPRINDRTLETDLSDQQRTYAEKYCSRFVIISKEMVGTTIKEMESSAPLSGLTVDDYFLHSLCKPREYSGSVRSPMIHYVAEAPFRKEEFLNSIWLYYLRKRHQPEIFHEILNTRNTIGESLLDYVESMHRKGSMYDNDGLVGPVRNIINFACAHGGIYLKYPKKCEATQPPTGE